MSLLSDIGSLTGNTAISDFANTGIGQILSQAGTNAIQKKVTPKPAAQVVAPAPASTPVNVSSPGMSTTNKVLMYSGIGFAVLVVVYFIKKGRR